MKKYKFIDPDGERFGKEPVVLFRAKDRFFPLVVSHYINILKAHGYNEESETIKDMREKLFFGNAWQRENQGLVNYPDSV